MALSGSKIRVGVLRGGPSHEYDVSLQGGEHVLSLLRSMSDVYEPVDIFVSKEGDWHHSGLRTSPHKILPHTDVIWNALHGSYGEDGQVQKILQDLQIPFTGSLAVPSALSINKEMTKDMYARHELLIPKHEVITEDNFNDEIVMHIFRNYMHPVVVKPSNSGSSVGVRLAHGIKELKEAIEHAFNFSKKVLVEERVRGKEASCGVVEHARGETVYALVPTGGLSVSQNKEIERAAKLAHKILGLRHYSQSDFIITPKGKVYILETDSQPNFSQGSHLHKSLDTTGWQPKDFVHHIIQLTLGKLNSVDF